MSINKPGESPNELGLRDVRTKVFESLRNKEVVWDDWNCTDVLGRRVAKLEGGNNVDAAIFLIIGEERIHISREGWSGNPIEEANQYLAQRGFKVVK